MKCCSPVIVAAVSLVLKTFKLSQINKTIFSENHGSVGREKDLRVDVGPVRHGPRWRQTAARSIWGCQPRHQSWCPGTVREQHFQGESGLPHCQSQDCRAGGQPRLHLHLLDSSQRPGWVIKSSHVSSHLENLRAVTANNMVFTTLNIPTPYCYLGPG